MESGVAGARAKTQMVEADFVVQLNSVGSQCNRLLFVLFFVLEIPSLLLTLLVLHCCVLCR